MHLRQIKTKKSKNSGYLIAVIIVLVAGYISFFRLTLRFFGLFQSVYKFRLRLQKIEKN